MLPWGLIVARVEIGQFIGRYSELKCRQQGPVTERLTHKSMTLPAAGINMDGAGEQNGTLPASYSLHEQYVFHQAYLGEATNLLENTPPQKDTLVTVG